MAKIALWTSRGGTPNGCIATVWPSETWWPRTMPSLRGSSAPWRAIIALRNFAAHQYDGLEPGRVWRTLTTDVPALRTYLTDTVIPGLRQD